MKEILPSLPTRQLVDMGEDLNVWGQTDEDWDLFDYIKEELLRRQDLTVTAPYWLFD
jgi:hypothetical protein